MLLPVVTMTLALVHLLVRLSVPLAHLLVHLPVTPLLLVHLAMVAAPFLLMAAALLTVPVKLGLVDGVDGVEAQAEAVEAGYFMRRSRVEIGEQFCSKRSELTLQDSYVVVGCWSVVRARVPPLHARGYATAPVRQSAGAVWRGPSPVRARIEPQW